jgi:hypothetical protein
LWNALRNCPCWNGADFPPDLFHELLQGCFRGEFPDLLQGWLCVRHLDIPSSSCLRWKMWDKLWLGPGCCAWRQLKDVSMMHSLLISIAEVAPPFPWTSLFHITNSPWPLVLLLIPPP